MIYSVHPTTLKKFIINHSEKDDKKNKGVLAVLKRLLQVFQFYTEYDYCFTDNNDIIA